jgi:protein ImuB
VSLWLCLRFEQLPLQCLSRSEDKPVAVLTAQRVLRANDCAAALGIRQGMGTATVRALAHEEPVQLLERDEAAEARCLQQLCCWAYSITPVLHIWRKDCLQLEIEGCLNLFNGLDVLLAEVSSGISSRGFRAHYGLAPTPAAAWLLSFSDNENNGDNASAIQQPLEERLSPLPLSLLTEFRETVDSLRRAGLHHFGDILALPAKTLGRRCGKPFTHFLQQVLGQREDLRPDYKPPATFNDEYWFGYEVKTNEELMPAVQQLLQSLCRFLRNTQLRTSDITWRLVGIDQKVRNIRVYSSSSHSDWESWYRLTRLRFEQLQLDGSVEGLTLECESLLPGQLDNIDMFSPRNQREPLAALLDKLRNRLGLQAIEKMGCRDEHLPELTVFLGSDEPKARANIPVPCAQRPFWLMPEPQELRLSHGRLYWNSPKPMNSPELMNSPGPMNSHGAGNSHGPGNSHRNIRSKNALELIYGPERIEDNWWRKPASRDYYVASNSSGLHYWVFCERSSRQWYIHGIFS